jgi:hypothetical protein
MTASDQMLYIMMISCFTLNTMDSPKFELNETVLSKLKGFPYKYKIWVTSSIEQEISIKIQNLSCQQYLRAWSDYMDVQAGLALW